MSRKNLVDDLSTISELYQEYDNHTDDGYSIKSRSQTPSAVARKERVIDAVLRKTILEKLRHDNELDRTIAQSKAKQKEDKRIKLLWQKAMFEGAQNKHSVSLSWQNFGIMHHHIYEYPQSFGVGLMELRIPGMGLKVLPDEFCEKLVSLQVLSLNCNQLEYLPDNITILTNLCQLNLVKNKLKKLPMKIGLMCALHRLEVQNNLIDELPITFGALNSIERVDLECNLLTYLPENLDNMLCCKHLNVNNNRLVRLPRCLGRMPSLTALSAFNNSISYIPEELANNTQLRILRLSINNIRFIPLSFGNLKKLREITVENNKLINLPISFHNLTKLKVLRIDGNEGLQDPPAMIINGGAQAVVQYLKDKFTNDEAYRMRLIVGTFQNVLMQIDERNLADISLFECNVKIDGEVDPFYGFQFEYFWSTWLPKLRKLWRQDALRGMTNPSHITSYPYDEKETTWAVGRFNDSYGPVFRKQKAFFRRCSCIDENSKRKPCAPPRVGYMCSRLCSLVKMRLVFKRQKADRLWRIYKENGLTDAVKRAEKEAKGFLVSVEGKIWLEDTAFERAEEALMDVGATTVALKKQRILDKKKRRIISKYDRMSNRVTKVRDKKAVVLNAELDTLKEAVKTAVEGYMKTTVENRIDELTIEIAKLPETLLLIDLQRRCKVECEELEQEMIEDLDSDSSANTDETLPSSDDETPAAKRKRVRIARRKKKEIKLQIEQKKRVEVEIPPQNLFEEIEHQVTTKIKKYAKIIPRNSAWESNIVKAARRFEKKLRHVADVAELRIKRLQNKASGNFTEIQQEMKHDLYVQYIANSIHEARDKALKEFSCIEQVRQYSQGASTEIVFKEWKKYHFSRKQRERRDLRETWRVAIKGFNTAMESVRSAQVQLDFWQRYEDIYTDIPFWENKLTGEITTEKPSLNNFLPPRFQVPLPPGDLPEGVSLDTSSDEDELNYVIQTKKTLKEIIGEEEERKKKQEEILSDEDESSVEQSLLTSIQSSEVDVKEDIRLYERRDDVQPNNTILNELNDEFSASSKSTQKSKQSNFSYGPDSLRKNKLGRSGRPIFQEEGRVEVLSELESRVMIAREYMKSDTYKSQTIELPDIYRSNINEIRQFNMQRVNKEVDVAERVIKKYRVNISGARHNTYIKQANRVPKSFEQIVAARKPAEVVESKDYKPPSPEKLLDMAGGDINMTTLEGAEGNHLRTVLAYRALHIKNKLFKKAVDKDLTAPKKTWFSKNVAVIWKESHESDEEEDEAVQERRLKEERRQKRKKERESASIVANKFSKLGQV